MPPTNANRAEWADEAVREFARATRMDTAGEEDETILRDLLVDLRHWCDERDIDFNECAEGSEETYSEEYHEQRLAEDES